ncbi:unnamed protein product [Calicophoron daubneyi]|uniref:Uncharacterized protein n=1 Tax=Calicophoron daubneyi TaxID=300641 RepID=A0AAV2TTR1_CALDB
MDTLFEVNGRDPKGKLIERTRPASREDESRFRDRIESVTSDLIIWLEQQPLKLNTLKMLNAAIKIGTLKLYNSAKKPRMLPD